MSGRFVWEWVSDAAARSGSQRVPSEVVMYEDQPVGDICVLHDPQKEQWTVSICRGMANPTRLGKFSTLEDAMEFATTERERRREKDGVELTIHLPDDCPCYRTYRNI